MKHISIVLLSTITFFYSCTESVKEKQNILTSDATANYKYVKLEKGGVASTIKLPAQLTAYQEVSIFPKLNGFVKSVFVDIGTKVISGTPLLMLEAPELDQAVIQAREKYSRAKAEYLNTKERYKRLLEASETAGAISPLDLSSAKSKMDGDSAIANAEKANWQMQTTMLGYLKVTAPFSGVITERNVHPGALVSAAEKGKPLLDLKQVDRLRLQVDVPENISSNLKNTDTVSFFVSALQGKRMIGFINRRSKNINSQYRNERMEIDVDNHSGILNPGMYVDAIFYSKGNPNAFRVPKSAVVTSTERKYVLVKRNGKIKKVDISSGNESAALVEIFGYLNLDDEIMINANEEIIEN